MKYIVLIFVLGLVLKKSGTKNGGLSWIMGLVSVSINSSILYKIDWLSNRIGMVPFNRKLFYVQNYGAGLAIRAFFLLKCGENRLGLTVYQ